MCPYFTVWCNSEWQWKWRGKKKREEKSEGIRFARGEGNSTAFHPFLSFSCCRLCPSVLQFCCCLACCAAVASVETKCTERSRQMKKGKQKKRAVVGEFIEEVEEKSETSLLVCLLASVCEGEMWRMEGEKKKGEEDDRGERMQMVITSRLSWWGW